jgi:hypothetical protein
VADLSARSITFTDPVLAAELCEEASDFLRDEIGWQVYPAAEITIAHRRGLDQGHEVHLPGTPIRGISQVAIDGVVIDPARWELVDNVLIFGIWRLEPYWQLRRPEASIIEVTYTVGYDSPPSELMRWTRVLVADALARIADGLPIGATPAALGVDDFKVQFSAQQQAGELPIPQRVLERLRARYGSTAFVTS